jgi:hypothetical protein
VVANFDLVDSVFDEVQVSVVILCGLNGFLLFCTSTTAWETLNHNMMYFQHCITTIYGKEREYYE